MKAMRLVIMAAVLTMAAVSLHALNFYSIGLESQGRFDPRTAPLDPQAVPGVTNVDGVWGLDLAVSGMGPKKLFFIWDVRVKVGFFGTNNNIDRQDLSFGGADFMGGLGYRISSPPGFGIEIAPTVSAYLDITGSRATGFMFQYGPAVGLNVFLKLTKGFGVGIRGIAKYSIPTGTFQPSIQAGVLF